MHTMTTVYTVIRLFSNGPLTNFWGSYISLIHSSEEPLVGYKLYMACSADSVPKKHAIETGYRR